jgi:CO dehydrogenase/acetyl-CoA synthase delta subunit
MGTESKNIKIQTRIDQLRQSNDHSVIHLQQLDAERQKTVNDILLTNGRILELEEILKEK